MAGKKRPTRRPQRKLSTTSRVPQPLTADALVYIEYDITDDPLENRAIKKLPSQVQVRIDDLYELAQHDPRQAIPELEHLVTGGENETCKIPDRLSLSHGTGWCEAEVFRYGRWHVIKAQLVSAKAIDVLRFVGRQPRNDIGCDGIAFIDQGL